MASVPNIQDEMDHLEEHLLRGDIEVTKVSSDGKCLRKVMLKMGRDEEGDSWLEMLSRRRNLRLRLKDVALVSMRNIMLRLVISRGSSGQGSIDVSSCLWPPLLSY